MGTAIVLMAIVALIVLPLLKSSAPNVGPPDKPSGQMPPKLVKHQQILTEAFTKCLNDHPDAVPALICLAASDGKVSRQELRIILRFCRKVGSVIDVAAEDAVESVGDGLRLDLKINPKDFPIALKQLKEKESDYRIAFVGAAHQMCGTSKRLSSEKRRFLDMAEQLTFIPD